MKFAWLTKAKNVNVGQSGVRVIHDTLMIVPFDDTNETSVIAMLKDLAQATHTHAVICVGWGHNPLVWDDDYAYDADDESKACQYQISIVYTPSDKELDSMPDYKGVIGIEEMRGMNT